ncbi:hypothetical protein ACT5GY_14060 [Lactiplantibacillus plantarum]
MAKRTAIPVRLQIVGTMSALIIMYAWGRSLIGQPLQLGNQQFTWLGLVYLTGAFLFLLVAPWLTNRLALTPFDFIAMTDHLAMGWLGYLILIFSRSDMVSAGQFRAYTRRAFQCGWWNLYGCSTECDLGYPGTLDVQLASDLEESQLADRTIVINRQLRHGWHRLGMAHTVPNLSSECHCGNYRDCVGLCAPFGPLDVSCVGDY